MRGTTRGALAIALILGLAAACSDDDGESSSEPTDDTTSSTASTTSTTTASSTTATPGPLGACPQAPAGSSPSTFDDGQGTYAVQKLSVDATAPSVTFDVVQILSGDDAKAQWAKDHPDEPDGPPNDYLIVNVNPAVRTAIVREASPIRVTHLSTDGNAEVEPETLDGLAAYTGDGYDEDTYWLTFDDGEVVEICQQYRP